MVKPAGAQTTTLAGILVLTLLGGCAGPRSRPPASTSEASALDGLWVPSPPEVIAVMLELARVTPTDVVYDLGSGEGEMKLLRELEPGTRIVSHDFGLADWAPEKTVEVPLERRRRVFLWTVPPRPPH